MWSIDDVESVNAKDESQASSFLAHLRKIGAATEVALCQGSDLLESKSGPYVLAFAQVPFPLRVPNEPFTVRGWRQGVTVELRFTVERARFDLSGNLIDHVSSTDDAQPDEVESPIARFTQVTGLVRLWTRRAALHKTYLNCLTPDGLRNDVIGRVGDWMDSPEAQMPLPARRYAPLTAQAFQADVARRIRTEFIRAIHSFVRSYGVAHLEDLPGIETLYGYFLMIAPGRVACASAPLPIVSGLCADQGLSLSSEPDPRALRSLLDKPLPIDDRVLRQLMAMHRLLKAGEPELALIGCVTAVEWFLNERFASRLRDAGSKRRGSFSVNDFMASDVLKFVPPAQLQRLAEVARLRNSVVHGAPPHRTQVARAKASLSGHVDEAVVRQAIFLALETYRAINRHLES